MMLPFQRAADAQVTGGGLLQAYVETSAEPFSAGSRTHLLKQIMRSTRDCYKLLDLDGTLRWMNIEGQERLGIKDFCAFTGTAWLDFWNEEDRRAAAAALDVARAGACGRFEGYFRTLLGEDTWWDVSITLITADSGEPEGMLAVSREITARRNAEAALARKSRELQLIVDRIPALVAYLNADREYQWINPRYEEWYGLSAKDVVGKPWYEVLGARIGEEYVEQLRPRVEAALAGFPQSFEAVHQFGGTRRDLHLSYSPDWDEAGHVRGFVVLATDITEQRRVQNELLHSEKRFRTLAQAIPSVVWTTSAEGELDYLSDRFREMTGLPLAEGLGSQWVSVIHEEDRDRAVTKWAASVKTGTKFDEQYRIRQQDGSYRWYLARALPQRNDTGEITRWVGVSTDIHRQVSAERTLRQSESRYRLLFEDNPLPMWTYHREKLRFTSVNEAAIRAYGHSREEFLAMHVSEIIAHENPPRFAAVDDGAPSGPCVPVRHRRKDGSTFWAEVREHDLSDSEGKMRLVLAQDVSERVRLHQELIRRAEHDPLTRLPNRTLLTRYFNEARQRADRNQSKALLIAIDFDRFKQVNDTFGHQIGDEFLRAATQRIHEQLRHSDVLARLGGDEFVGIVEGVTSVEECTQAVKRILGTMHSPLEVGQIQFQPTISVGISIYPDDGSSLEDLMRRADYGLYEAKRAGRNCWKRYVPSQMYDVKEALEIERSLRAAFDEQRLLLHYQPIFSATGEIRAIEALARLLDPRLGLVPPGRFIPVAEESGLIHSLGVWVLREVCRQSREWCDQGLEPVPVAVNVSATQFCRGSLAEEVRSAIDEFGIEPRYLEIELTESLLMENTEHSRRQLAMLKDIGVRVSMDDFGTGYSSLSYLHALPIDTLKIDRTFIERIRDCGSDPIVKAIVELGKNLSLTVVAEGVETEVQRKELVRLECDLLQGFLLSKPQPATAIRSLLVRSRKWVQNDKRQLVLSGNCG